MIKTQLKMMLIGNGNVYLCTKPGTNEDAPYDLSYNRELTEIYRRNGLLSLDGEVIRLLYSTHEIVGDHPSVSKYRYTLASINPTALTIFQRYTKALAAAYKKLSDEERNHIWNPIYSTDVQNYKVFEREETDKMYLELAKLVQPYYLQEVEHE